MNDVGNSAEFLKMKNKLDVDLKNIRKDCQSENKKTAQLNRWLTKQGEKTDFWSKRADFVSKTLDEFGHLGPSAFESIFEHKIDEIAKQRSENREEIYH